MTARQFIEHFPYHQLVLQALKAASLSSKIIDIQLFEDAQKEQFGLHQFYTVQNVEHVKGNYVYQYSQFCKQHMWITNLLILCLQTKHVHVILVSKLYLFTRMTHNALFVKQ